MDYAAIGPEHSLLRDLGRAEYYSVTDEEAVDGFDKLSQCEGASGIRELTCGVVIVREQDIY